MELDISSLCTTLGQSIKSILQDKETGAGSSDAWKELLKAPILQLVGLVKGETSAQEIKDVAYLLLQSIKKINLVLDTTDYEYFRGLCVALAKEIRLLSEAERKLQALASVVKDLPKEAPKRASVVSRTTVKESLGVNDNVITTTTTTTNKNNRKSSHSDRIAPKPNLPKPTPQANEPSDVEVAVRALVLKLLQAHANTDSEGAAHSFKELAALINRIRQHDTVTNQQRDTLRTLFLAVQPFYKPITSSKRDQDELREAWKQFLLHVKECTAGFPASEKVTLNEEEEARRRQLERLRMKQSDDAKKKEAEQNRRKILSLLEDEEMNLEAAEKEKMRKESEFVKQIVEQEREAQRRQEQLRREQSERHNRDDAEKRQKEMANRLADKQKAYEQEQREMQRAREERLKANNQKEAELRAQNENKWREEQEASTRREKERKERENEDLRRRQAQLEEEQFQYTSNRLKYEREWEANKVKRDAQAEENFLREVQLEREAYETRKERAEQEARRKRDERSREEDRRKIEEGRRILLERQRQRDVKEREKARQLQEDMRDYRAMLDRLQVPKEKHESMFAAKWGSEWRDSLIAAKEDQNLQTKIDQLTALLHQKEEEDRREKVLEENERYNAKPVETREKVDVKKVRNEIFERQNNYELEKQAEDERRRIEDERRREQKREEERIREGREERRREEEREREEERRRAEDRKKDEERRLAEERRRDAERREADERRLEAERLEEEERKINDRMEEAERLRDLRKKKEEKLRQERKEEEERLKRQKKEEEERLQEQRKAEDRRREERRREEDRMREDWHRLDEERKQAEPVVPEAGSVQSLIEKLRKEDEEYAKKQEDAANRIQQQRNERSLKRENTQKEYERMKLQKEKEEQEILNKLNKLKQEKEDMKRKMSQPRAAPTVVVKAEMPEPNLSQEDLHDELAEFIDNLDDETLKGITPNSPRPVVVEVAFAEMSPPKPMRMEVQETRRSDRHSALNNMLSDLEEKSASSSSSSLSLSSEEEDKPAKKPLPRPSRDIDALMRELSGNTEDLLASPREDSNESVFNVEDFNLDSFLASTPSIPVVPETPKASSLPSLPQGPGCRPPRSVASMRKPEEERVRNLDSLMREMTGESLPSVPANMTVELEPQDVHESGEDHRQDQLEGSQDESGQGDHDEHSSHERPQPSPDDDIDSLLAGLSDPNGHSGKSARIMNEDDLDQFLVGLAMPKAKPAQDSFQDRHLDSLMKELVDTGEYDRVRTKDSREQRAPSNVDLNNLDFDIDDLLDTLTNK